MESTTVVSCSTRKEAVYILLMLMWFCNAAYQCTLKHLVSSYFLRKLLPSITSLSPGLQLPLTALKFQEIERLVSGKLHRSA